MRGCKYTNFLRRKGASQSRIDSALLQECAFCLLQVLASRLVAGGEASNNWHWNHKSILEVYKSGYDDRCDAQRIDWWKSTAKAGS